MWTANDCLTLRDVSLQSTRLMLPGKQQASGLPEEIVQALDEVETQLRNAAHAVQPASALPVYQR